MVSAPGKALGVTAAPSSSPSADPPRAPRGGAGLPRLPPLRERDPGRVRRGAAHARGDASSASSPATRRISPAGRSSAPPGSCSTRRSRRRASTARRPTSRTRSSTSSGRHAASGGSTRSRTGRRSAACRPWLEAELEVVRPRVLVVPRRDRGAVAARQGLPRHEAAGRAGRVRPRRARTATVHPSSILRQRDEEPARPSSQRSSPTCASSPTCWALRLRDRQRERAGALHPLDLKLKRPLAAELERNGLRPVVLAEEAS